MIFTVIFFHLLLYTNHSLLIFCVFLLNRTKSLSDISQWRLFRRRVIVINSDCRRIPARRGVTPHLRVGVDHIISGVIGVGMFSLMLDGGQLPHLHSLIHVFLNPLFCIDLCISGDWKRFMPCRLLLELVLLELYLMDFFLELFSFSLKLLHIDFMHSKVWLSQKWWVVRWSPGVIVVIWRRSERGSSPTSEVSGRAQFETLWLKRNNRDNLQGRFSWT